MWLTFGHGIGSHCCFLKISEWKAFKIEDCIKFEEFYGSEKEENSKREEEMKMKHIYIYIKGKKTFQFPSKRIWISGTSEATNDI